MRPESGILVFTVLFVALADFGHSRAALAADDELAKQPNHQMATLIGAPDEGAATPRTVRTFDALTDHFWPLAEDDGSIDVNVTFSEQFSTDDATDDELLSPGTATAEGGEPDAPPGPINFRIGESFKIKAQPVGGGLGGRVTFTFLLPTGAER